MNVGAFKHGGKQQQAGTMLGHRVGPPALGAAAEGALALAPHYGTAGSWLCPQGQLVPWLWSSISILLGPDLPPEAAKSEVSVGVCGCLGLLLSCRAVSLLLMLNHLFIFFNM